MASWSKGGCSYCVAKWLTLGQLDGDCRELLRECAPVLVTVKVPEVKDARNRRPGLPRPDYSEKSQSRRTPTSSAGAKVPVNVTLAPGLQVKDPSRRPKSATSLDVFRDSAAGALPANLLSSVHLSGISLWCRAATLPCPHFLPPPPCCTHCWCCHPKMPCAPIGFLHRLMPLLGPSVCLCYQLLVMTPPPLAPLLASRPTPLPCARCRL